MNPTEMLRKRAHASSIRAVAREAKCSAAYVSDVLSGKRAPGPKILAYLGIEKAVRYRKLSEAPGP